MKQMRSRRSRTPRPTRRRAGSCRSVRACLPLARVFRRGQAVMLDAAVKALSQILSPPMRSILWRSIGLALVLIVVLAIGLQRLLSWFATYGEGWAEAMLGPGFHTPLNVLAWIVSIAAGLGVVLGAVSPDARDHLAGGERVRRRGRRPCRARTLSGRTSRRGAAVWSRHDRGHQDRAADDPGLSDRAALRVRWPAPASSPSSSRPPGCWDGNISSSRRCGFAARPKPRRCASKTPPRSSPRGW